ncbi:MAG TPA: hypothetical protein VMW94_09515 [Actinomycetes bacterium]|nr:hypothetical protein [Actinomycetes bacterium]
MIGLVGAAMVLGGAFLPWVTVDYWSGDAFGYNYGEGAAGPILLVCAAVIGLASLLRLSSQVTGGSTRLVVVAAALAAALCAGVVWNELTGRVAVPLQYMFDVYTYRSLFNGLGGGHVGPGPLLAAAGAFVALVGGLLRR